MKRYFAVLSIIGLFLSCTHLTSTESPPAFDSIVIGRSDSTQDVQAVQEAIEKGGTVLLKGAFDFGSKGKVTIKNDVAVTKTRLSALNARWSTREKTTKLW